MRDKLEALGNQTLIDIEAAMDAAAIEQIRLRVFGKKGALSEVLKGLGQVSALERPQIGAFANTWKERLEEGLASRGQICEERDLDKRLAAEAVDVTAPARRLHPGSLHILTQTTRRIAAILGRLGFESASGPEIETEYFNFEAVNIPADHPARQMHDTFFIKPGHVLRTHTSSVQMRVLREKKPPIRIFAAGAVYRCEADATHSPLFHQIEGLFVDKGVRMSDLKGVLGELLSELFGTVKFRMRPSYFPFVEPGAEVDIECFKCRGVGHCQLCRSSGWIEVLGCGMVHPFLLTSAGVTDVTGFALGLGVERMAMLLHEVNDIRHMFQGDMRFLQLFRFRGY